MITVGFPMRKFLNVADKIHGRVEDVFSYSFSEIQYTSLENYRGRMSRIRKYDFYTVFRVGGGEFQYAKIVNG
jgi:hypothetical protein